MPRRPILAPATVLTLLLGCHPKPSSPPGQHESQPPLVDASAAQMGRETCVRYASALCNLAGPGSTLCDGSGDLVALLPPRACDAGLRDLSYSEEQAAGLRRQCDEVVAKLCREIGETSETCASIREQTASFPVTRCGALASDYDAVLAEVQAMESQRRPLPAELARELAAGDVPSFGPADASVTLVEFSDFECPYCAKAAEVVAQIRADYGDRVRFVYRQFPLSFHPQAHLAAQAALAAHAQGKFWPYHDLLFANQGALSQEALVGYAKQIGLETRSFRAALTEQSHRARVEEDLALGAKASVRGTPTLFVNGLRVADPTDEEMVRAALDAALTETR